MQTVFTPSLAAAGGTEEGDGGGERPGGPRGGVRAPAPRHRGHGRETQGGISKTVPEIVSDLE